MQTPAETHTAIISRLKKAKWAIPFQRVGGVLIFRLKPLSPKPVGGMVDRPLSLWRMASATPDLRLPSQPQSITAHWPYQAILLVTQAHGCEQLAQSYYSLPLSFPAGSGGGGGLPPQSSPGNSIAIADLLTLHAWVTSPSEPGCVLGTGRTGARQSLQRRCNGDTWQSPGIWYGVGKLPALENGQSTAEPPLRTGNWSSHVASAGECARCLSVKTLWTHEWGSLWYLPWAMSCLCDDRVTKAVV